MKRCTDAANLKWDKVHVGRLVKELPRLIRPTAINMRVVDEVHKESLGEYLRCASGAEVKHLVGMMLEIG